MDIDLTQVHEYFKACGRIDLKGKAMNHTNNIEELLFSALFKENTTYEPIQYKYGIDWPT